MLEVHSLRLASCSVLTLPTPELLSGQSTYLATNWNYRWLASGASRSVAYAQYGGAATNILQVEFSPSQKSFCGYQAPVDRKWHSG